MKISIGYKVFEKPWGGGNQFVRSLIMSLKTKGFDVINHLNDNDIDIILIIDPRSNHPNVTFTPAAIIRYLLFKNSNAIVIHRINECDQRKNTKTMNFRLRIANFCSDHTVLVGSWLKKLNVIDHKNIKNITVIKNGSNKEIFNSDGYIPWQSNKIFKFVTHHWSGNWMKGFDIYKKLDMMLGNRFWKDKVQFTYIGNIPKNFHFQNTRHVKPLNEIGLARELKNHHGYLTASINEPGGNHQNEGALCGLPLLYRDSGCLPEYCKGYGIAFNFDNFEKKISEFIEVYPTLKNKMKNYPHTNEKTNKMYFNLFEKLKADKFKIKKDRDLLSSPLKILINHIV